MPNLEIGDVCEPSVPSEPELHSVTRFTSVLFTTLYAEAPPEMQVHLRRVALTIPNRGRSVFDVRAIVATHVEAEVFLQNRGYVRVGTHDGHGVYLPPLDASLYRQSVRAG